MKQNIFVLFGGKSSERDVSMNTGRQVLDNLDRNKYNAIPLEVDRDRFWLKKVIERKDDVDVAFLALHGGSEENGSIQGLLEYLGIKYTGSKVLASALGMDKFYQSKIFKIKGMLVPQTFFLDLNQNLSSLKNKLEFPLVLKPNDQGSSVGVMMLDNAQEFDEAVNELTVNWSQHKKVLLQRKIEGREFTCGVITDQSYKQIDVFPVIEIKPNITDFYSYQDKYEDAGSEHIIPAKLNSLMTDLIKKQAITAHKLLGCSGLTRTDFILDKRDRLYVLEINTLPGMTSTSLCPEAARAYGWSFRQLLDEVINRA